MKAIVLDTNVVSELMRTSPRQDVQFWMDEHRSRQLFVTAITEAEIRTGIAHLPAGARRQRLADAAERMLAGLFAGRVLPFDSRAARAFAETASASRIAGHPISQSDCQIAAIALAHGMAVATRNVRDFSDAGIEIVNPWASA